jgi:hypothetical protein
MQCPRMILRRILFGVSAVPNLFLVGVQRSATTALWTYLRQHPQVFMGPKELHHFGLDLGRFGDFTNRGARPDLAQYLSYFDAATTERYLGDASVGYIYSRTAASEIHDFSPDARIVVSFRNPVDMIYSLYSLLRFQGVEPCASLEEALEDREKPRWAFTAWPFRWAFTYRDVVRYSEQLERYYDRFGADRVHIVVYEDFVDHPRMTYRELLGFLDVDQTYLPELSVVNANRKLWSKVVNRWLYRPPAFVRRSGKMVFPARPVRKELGKKVIAHNRREVRRPKLDDTFRLRLEEELAPEVSRLSELIGRDLSSIWWRTDSLAAN